MENSDKIYIRINKMLCAQTESKFENRPHFNIMRLPRGTVVGDTDLSFCMINPIVMIEDQKNPKMYCAIYDRNKLTDNAIKVYMEVGGEKKYMPIDADKLRDAVAKANHAYYEEHKKERAQEQEAEPKIGKEKKIEPLTTDKLRDEELVQA